MSTGTTTVLAFPSQSTPDEELAPRARVRLELTRRGRMVLTALAFLLGLLVASAVLQVTDLPAALAGPAEAPRTVTVQPGDTLWGYAQQYAPAGMSDEEFVAEVRSANHLPTGRVTAGQEIELPALEDSGR